MKKICVAFFLSIAICAIASQACFAIRDYGDFTYWYSDDSRIGFYSPTTINIYYTKTANFGMADSNYTSADGNAFDVWKATTELTRTSGTSSNYNWQTIGCSRTEGNSLGFPSDVNGATAAWESSSLYGAGHYNGAQKNIYTITKTTTYFVWDSSTQYKNSDWSNSKWNAVFAHEFGHALGYAGHDSGATSSNKSLMNYSSSYYYDQWSVSTPQTRDVNEMDQLY